MYSIGIAYGTGYIAKENGKELCNILDWIDGTPKNDKIWNKWKQMINKLKIRKGSL